MGTHQLFVVDPSQKDRESYQSAFRGSDYRVMMSSTAEGFLNSDAGLRADCLITELCLRHPSMDGMFFFRNVVKSLPVIVAAAEIDAPTAKTVMALGAVHVFEKPVCMEDLLATVKQAVEVGDQLREQTKRKNEWTRRIATLTPREVEVMGLVLRGVSTRNIAKTLGISDRTAESHRTRLMKKLGTKNTVKLIRAAMAQEIEQV